MNVTFIWDDIGAYGGVRTFLLACLRHLPRLGIQPHLLDLAARPTPLDPEAAACPITRLTRNPWNSDAAWETRVCHTLRQQQPNLLIFTEWRFAADVLRCVPDTVPAANLCLVDRPDEAYYANLDTLAQRLRLIIANSHKIVEKLRARLKPTQTDRVQHLFIGVDPPTQLSPDPKPGQPLKLIHMARLDHQQKRARDLVPFVRDLNDTHTPFHLTIVGDGPERSWITRQLAPEIKNNQVTLTGALPYTQAIPLLEQHHILLLFSAYEGMPLVLLHALVAGLLPIVSRIDSGINEIVDDGVNGLCFPVGAPALAAVRVQSLYQEHNRLLQLKRAAHTTGKDCLIDTTLEHFAAMLHNLTPKNHKPPRWNHAFRPTPEALSPLRRLRRHLPLGGTRW